MIGMGLFGSIFPSSQPDEVVIVSNTPVWDRLRAEAEAIAPVDRFIDVSWEDWAVLRREMASHLMFSMMKEDKGLFLASHVYARPPSSHPPVDPALLAEVRQLAVAMEMILRKIGGAS